VTHRARLSVYVSVCPPAYLRNCMSNLHQFLCMLPWPWLCQRCNTLCTSGFIDSHICIIMPGIGDAKKTRKLSRQGAALIRYRRVCWNWPTRGQHLAGVRVHMSCVRQSKTAYTRSARNHALSTPLATNGVFTRSNRCSNRSTRPVVPTIAPCTQTCSCRRDRLRHRLAYNCADSRADSCLV